MVLREDVSGVVSVAEGCECERAYEGLSEGLWESVRGAACVHLIS